MHLPKQMPAGDEHEKAEWPARVVREPRREHQGEGDGIESENPVSRSRPKETRCRFHSDERVVVRVLERVDRVIAQRPEDEARIKKKVGPVDASGLRRKAKNRAPVERKSEPCLRPPRDPLHEG